MPFFKKSVGGSERHWNNMHCGTSGGASCQLCGKEWPEGEEVLLGRFLGLQIVEECCGKVFDIVYKELGEEIVREYLEDFSKNPLDSDFGMMLNHYLPEAVEEARKKAEEFLQKSNIKDDIAKIQEVARKK